MSGVERCAFLNAYIFLKKSIILFFVHYLVLCIICFEYLFRTVIYTEVLAVSQSDLCFLKRYTSACGCACSAIIFLGLRKRLRRKNLRVVERALAAQLL